MWRTRDKHKVAQHRRVQRPSPQPDVPKPMPGKGWFDCLPTSWMHLLVRTLAPEERLMLFQVNRHLAYHVVQSAPSVELRLGTHPPPSKLEAKRKVIASLLHGRKGWWLCIKTRRAKGLPVPMELCSHVTRIDSCQDGGDSSFDWGSFPNLTEARFLGYLSERDITSLCTALSCGRLQQLCALKITYTHVSMASLQQLSQALTAQLTTLCTSKERMLDHLHLFKALHSIKLDGIDIVHDVGRSLVEHSTLRMVELNDACKLHGDYRQCRCSWETVAAKPGLLSFLPLAGLRHILIRHASWNDRSELPHLQAILGNHEGKIKCEPPHPKGSFTVAVAYANDATVFLLRYVSGCVSVMLRTPWEQTGLLTALWTALPASVQGLRLYGRIPQDDLGQFWHGLPHTIQTVWMPASIVPSEEELRWLVRTTPVHVKKLVLMKREWSTVLGRRLRNAKRAHVELELIDWNIFTARYHGM